MTEATLRDRSRARRHSSIERAALRLFAERGYEATTIAEIAAEAEVSPRTVSLYFPSKLDLALSYLTDSATRFSDLLDSRAPGETTLDAYRQWVEDELGTHGEVRALHEAMLRSNPALRGTQTAGALAGRRATISSLAEDLGRAPDDVVVLLVGGAMGGVLSALGQIRPDHADPREVLEIAERMLRALTDTARAGRPVGRTRRASA